MQHDQGYFEETRLGKTYDIKLLKRLYPFARPYRLLLFGSIGLVLLITCLDLALPYVTKIAIDRYIVPATVAAAPARSSDGMKDERAIRVDLAEPQQRALVDKYHELFEIEGETALISYHKLSAMDKSDLAELRKNDLAGIGWITG